LLIQRNNVDKLNSMVQDYRPSLFSRNWGTDPDYIAMNKQLKSITDTYNQDINAFHFSNEENEEILPEIQLHRKKNSSAKKHLRK
jgi:hypothetical protein